MLTEILTDTGYWIADFLNRETIWAGTVRAMVILSLVWFFAILPFMNAKVRRPYTHVTCGQTFRQGRKETKSEWNRRFNNHLNSCH